MSNLMMDTLLASAPGAAAQKKSAAIAYALWFVSGLFGGHRFYAGQTPTGTIMLLLTVLSIPLSLFGIGGIMLMIVALWTLIDLFRIGGMIEDYNMNLLLRHHLIRAQYAGASSQ